MSPPADLVTQRAPLGPPPATWVRVATALVAVAVVAFLTLTVVSQWHELQNAELRFAPGWLAGALLLLFISQAVQGELARLLLVRLGSPVPASRMRAIYGAGLLARYVPSGALMFVVRIAMEGRAGVPQRLAVLGMLYEFALGMSAAAFVCAPLLFRLDSRLGIVGVVMACVVAATLHPRVFVPAVNRILTSLGRPTVSGGVPLATILALTGLCVVSFVCNGVGVLCIVASVMAIPDGAAAAIIASAGTAFIASMLGFALPGGLGAREAGLTLALGTALAGPLAFSIALISRLLQTAVEVLYAAAGALHDRRAQTTA